MKHLSIAVFLAASGLAFSGTMGPACTNGNITLSCDNQGWDIGIQALYLQPSYGDDFRFLGFNNNGTQVRDYVANNPDWSWGFKLEGAYHYKAGNDVNLNWYHLDGKKTSFSQTVNFLNQGSLGGSSITTIDPQWDAVNLEFGKLLDLGEFKKIRLHGGVQYVYIKTNFAASGTYLYATQSYSVTTESKYQGLGPRIGADLAYPFMGTALSVYAKGATALLVGQSRHQRVTENNTFTTVGPSILSKNLVVPEIEAKLGLSYDYKLVNSLLTFDAGYLWLNYFGAQPTFYGNDPDNDFGLQGPYLGVKWIGVNT